MSDKGRVAQEPVVGGVIAAGSVGEPNARKTYVMRTCAIRQVVTIMMVLSRYDWCMQEVTVRKKKFE